jgi:hypothetical protein
LKVETGEHGHYFIQVGLSMNGRDNVGIKRNPCPYSLFMVKY